MAPARAFSEMIFFLAHSLNWPGEPGGWRRRFLGVLKIPEGLFSGWTRVVMDVKDLYI